MSLKILLRDFSGTLILIRELNIWQQGTISNFSASPRADKGMINLYIWNCSVPGLRGTLFENVNIPFVLFFPATYPKKPPCCFLEPPFITHLNVFSSGLLLLDLFSDFWDPTTSLYEILLQVQTVLHTPNERSVASAEAYALYRYEPELYKKLLDAQIQEFYSKQKPE
ncbi:uncharacterized protein LOC135120284 [Zophobas morio]|uniref:uncharacterized protein LOC135120284 n=1 Tax=Zophobas morio TaxID=2755281 RepID=UPI003082AE45